MKTIFGNLRPLLREVNHHRPSDDRVVSWKRRYPFINISNGASSIGNFSLFSNRLVHEARSRQMIFIWECLQLADVIWIHLLLISVLVWLRIKNPKTYNRRFLARHEKTLFIDYLLFCSNSIVESQPAASAHFSFQKFVFRDDFRCWTVKKHFSDDRLLCGQARNSNYPARWNWSRKAIFSRRHPIICHLRNSRALCLTSRHVDMRKLASMWFVKITIMSTFELWPISVTTKAKQTPCDPQQTRNVRQPLNLWRRGKNDGKRKIENCFFFILLSTVCRIQHVNMVDVDIGFIAMPWDEYFLTHVCDCGKSLSPLRSPRCSNRKQMLNQTQSDISMIDFLAELYWAPGSRRCFDECGPLIGILTFVVRDCS